MLLRAAQMSVRYQTIKCEIDGCRATLTLPGASSGVSVTESVAEELRDCCHELSLVDELRVVIVAGQGDVFSTGRERPPPGSGDASIMERTAWVQRMGAANAIARLPMPVVAVLNGDAVAHGLEIALAADLRIVADDARLGAGDPARFGFPFDGLTQRLPRLVGPTLARDMLLTGRMLSAGEALNFGLANRVASRDDLATASAEIVDLIAASAPIAARYAKEAVAAASDVTLAQGLRLEADLSIILQSTDDRAEGLRSFAEKRAPHFTGR